MGGSSFYDLMIVQRESPCLTFPSTLVGRGSTSEWFGGPFAGPSRGAKRRKGVALYASGRSKFLSSPARSRMRWEMRIQRYALFVSHYSRPWAPRMKQYPLFGKSDARARRRDGPLWTQGGHSDSAPCAAVQTDDGVVLKENLNRLRQAKTTGLHGCCARIVPPCGLPIFSPQRHADSKENTGIGEIPCAETQ
jgi:hypothetical protein